MSSDEHLVRRAAQGDRRALEAIYRRYHQELYRFCLAMVGNPQDAQDTLQNTMVKVLRALPGEERTIQLKPWLYRIARNESIETLRKRHDNDELEPQQALSTGVVERAESRDRLRTLLADLEQLPERQRAVLVLRELSGLDFDQIGATFETSPAVARQTLYEARLSLRQLEAGREMHCVEVMKELSNADGRVTRRREIRAHLRGCADCRAFRGAIEKRHEDLAGLAPLPLAASAAILQGVLGKATAASGAVVSGGGMAGGVGVGVGQAVATSAIVKSAATIAVVAVVGVSAADRGGIIDAPFPGSRGDEVHETAGDPPAPAAVETVGAASVPSRPSAETDRTPIHGTEGKVDGKSEQSGAEGDESDVRATAQDKAITTPGESSSASERGQNPPGGGYGRSASEQRGRPEASTDAAAHGQQTAASKKPVRSTPTKGKSNSTGSGNRETKGNAPAAKAPPLKAKAPAAPPGQPHAEPPGQTEDRPSQPGVDGSPLGQQR